MKENLDVHSEHYSYKKILRKINQKSEHYQHLSDRQLQARTKLFKKMLNNGKQLKDILVEAFATVREADRRVLKMYPFDEQVLGALVLNAGNLAEMKTGEGKTLTETMPVYLNALTGKGVHVVTVNNYLAQRDANQMGQVFRWLGLSVGYNSGDLNFDKKKEAYAADITYSTNSELAFDYLRDNMALTNSQQLQRGLNYAIIDEIDSILIDEARTPLIISGESESYPEIYLSADKFVKGLTEKDYQIDKETKTVSLTHQGVEKANHYFGINNLFSPDNLVLTHYVNNAMKANYTMKKDMDYVVKDNQLLLVDQYTGRIMAGRRFADGLHQAIEAKENMEIHEISHTDASITYQNFFRLYSKLAGMTGTAYEEKQEFYDTYHMRVVQIPTHKPNKRKDLPLTLYPTLQTKDLAILKLVQKLNTKGQPVLIGTASVEASERIHKLLTQNWISHSVLNAKDNEKEALIISKAGQKGAVTVATNMAGRGTDIKLGPGVRDLGGLYVVGTELHESSRIDNQLRGRAGRQGDPGISKFFASLEDDLIQRYGSERLKKIATVQNIKGSGKRKKADKQLNSWLCLHLVKTTQKKVEGTNFEQRRNVLRFDDVLRLERNSVYGQRQQILTNQIDLTKTIEGMLGRTIERKVNQYAQGKHNWKQKELINFVNGELNLDFPENKTSKPQKIKPLKMYLNRLCVAKLNSIYKQLIQTKQITEFQRVILLKSIDQAWKDNMDMMEQLRLSVSLRGYGQHNPLVEYQNIAHYQYKKMVAQLEERVTKNVLNAEIRQAGETQ